jgi:hypothetical protein
MSAFKRRKKFALVTQITTTVHRAVFRARWIAKFGRLITVQVQCTGLVERSLMVLLVLEYKDIDYFKISSQN